MRRTPWRASVLVLILSLAVMSCDGPNRGPNTQPSSASGFQIVVTASPNTVRGTTAGSGSAVGGCATVQAKVTDRGGSLIDGATVTLTTTLGTFPAAPPGGVLLGTNSVRGATVRGFFGVTYCAQSERGTATITASVEDAFATVLITVF